MTGHNSDEGRMFTEPSISNDSDYREWLEQQIPEILNDTIDEIAELYPADFRSTSEYTTQLGRVALAMGDFLVHCNAHALNTAFGNTSYAYQFSAEQGLHGDDVAYTFYDGGAESAVNVTLATVMQRYFVNFAVSGLPNDDRVPLFPTYNQEEVLNLNTTSMGPIQEIAVSKRCSVWPKAL